MLVQAFNIKYDTKTSIMSISGPNALQNFVEHDIFNYYNHQEAPTSYIVEINVFDEEFIDEIYDRTKKKLEEELGLPIKSFSLRY